MRMGLKAVLGGVAASLVGAAIPACKVELSSGKKDAPASTGEATSGASSVAAAPTQTPTASPAPQPSVVPVTKGGALAPEARAARITECKPACEHRKACGVGSPDEVETCTKECEALAFLYHGDVIGEYAKADCESVKAAEDAFDVAVGARKACAKRDECFGTTEVEACTVDLTGATWKPGHLDEYAGLPCAEIKAGNDGHLVVRSSVRACRRIVSCGVKGGDVQRCLDIVRANIDKKVYGVDKLAEWEGATCETLQATVTLESAPAPRPAGRPGGGGGAVIPATNGWFGGSWTDRDGKVRYDAPPAGRF